MKMFIIDIVSATFLLFMEMAPYLMLGLFFVGLLNIFITKDMIAKHIGDNSFASVLKAALFGIPLPLCSCGVVPSAVYMAKNGASKPAVVAFLTATPQTGIDSILATYGMLGPVFAVFRPIAALLMGIANGFAVRFLNFDEIKTQPVHKISLDGYTLTANPKKNLKFYYKKMAKYPFVEFLDDISLQFIAGLFIAGIITWAIPEDFFSGSIIGGGLPGMLALILISIPMYVCATASIPIALSLMLKGFSPGVAFVFLAAGPATNAASLSVISKVLGKKTTAVYVGMIAVLSVISGLFLDWLFVNIGLNTFAPINNSGIHQMQDFSIFQWIVSGIFLILLLLSVYRKFIKPKIEKKKSTQRGKQKVIIEGMTCNHCVANVRKAIAGTQGVKTVEVSLSDNAAYIEGNFDLNQLKNNVEEMGYKVIYG